MYIGARLEDSSSLHGKQKNIVRFMFFEAIARIGLQRFYNSGKGECATHAEAIQKTIETIEENWKFDNWEQWRWTFLY